MNYFDDISQVKTIKITVSCSMRLKDHLVQFIWNPIFFIPDLEWVWKSKEFLMAQHKEKIAKSDFVLVLHDGKIWESVKEEIEFAESLWKTVIMLDVRKSWKDFE